MNKYRLNEILGTLLYSRYEKNVYTEISFKNCILSYNDVNDILPQNK